MKNFMRRIQKVTREAEDSARDIERVYQKSIQDLEEDVLSQKTTIFQEINVALKEKGFALVDITQGEHTYTFKLLSFEASPESPVDPEAVRDVVCNILGFEGKIEIDENVFNRFSIQYDDHFGGIH